MSFHLVIVVGCCRWGDELVELEVGDESGVQHHRVEHHRHFGVAEVSDDLDPGFVVGRGCDVEERLCPTIRGVNAIRAT
ncbi:hypothetical protein [Rhodococcoides kroppenstedtii]|uniref:hypothetical protein n=1 Tax=Rhodococcoides kroppenstedtii TaxID=293050 RepID=UPI0036295DCF